MGTVWGFTQDVRNWFSLRSINDSLAMENFMLRARLAKTEGQASDSICTSQLPQDCIADGCMYIPAVIKKISDDPQHNYIIIDKGTADGVKEGSGIVTGKGVIGVVDTVSEKFSYARSFKNHSMSTSARLGRRGAAGQLCWDGIHSNGGILKEIPHHVEFSPGDTVYTSGYSSIFPPDIPLGTTGRSRIVNGSTYEIQIRLFEDFAALRYVTVVVNLEKEEIKRLEDRQ